MPSRLRFQTSFDDSEGSVQTIRRTSSPPPKKQKMSLSQTYFVAASARTKLGREACKADHNLRRLVGHANLLDALMLDLHDAEREQEAWFNQTVQKAATPARPRAIRWMDDSTDESMDDESEELDDAASESDESDDDDDDFALPTPRRIQVAPVSVSTREMDEDEEEDDAEDDEDDDEHALVRTISGSMAQSPPELMEDTESDDETPPPSPPALSIEFSEAQRQAIATTSFSEQKTAYKAADEMDYVENGYHLVSAESPSALMTAC